MANNIKGITVAIGGDTSGLQSSLKKANTSIKDTNKSLSEINKLLKFDPKNVDLLSQKERNLQTQVANVTKKLKELQDQDKDMQHSLKSGEISQQQYDKFQREIISTTSQLKNYKKQLLEVQTQQKGMNLAKLQKGFSDLGNSISGVGKKLLSFSSKALVGGVAAVSAAIVKLSKDSITAYASLEQNIGGVETLFGDSSQKVIDNASKAYKTAGLSANEYMENVTSFSASLLQSVGKDTEKAADIADMAMVDMADNANKMGTSMESIQSAYQGFAKQNYTMLD